MDVKACTRCKEVLPRSAFYEHKGRVSGKCRPCTLAYQAEYRHTHKDRQKELHANWRAKNLAKLRKVSKKWRETNYEQMRAIRKGWVERNPERAQAISRRAMAKRLQDPTFKLHNRIKVRLRQTLRASGTYTFHRLGYTADELREHIERQFLKGMSWENCGEWHIDHIVPLSAFTITGPSDPELKRAWALTNLRPLWAKDNLKKHAKRTHLI